MKKIRLFALMLALLLLLPSCKGGTEPENTDGPAQDTTVEDLIADKSYTLYPESIFPFTPEAGIYNDSYPIDNTLSFEVTFTLPKGLNASDEGLYGASTFELYKTHTVEKAGAFEGIYLLSEKAPFSKDIHAYTRSGQAKAGENDSYRLGYTPESYKSIREGTTESGLDYVLYCDEKLPCYAYVKLSDDAMIKLSANGEKSLLYIVESLTLSPHESILLEDGGTYLSLGNAHNEEKRFELIALLDRIEADAESYDELTQLRFGEGVVNVYLDKESEKLMAESVSAFGYMETFEEPLTLNANHVLYIFEAENCFVFEVANDDLYLMTTDGPCVSLQEKAYLEKPSEPWYNNDFYTYTLLESGKLGYTRTPRKYLYQQFFAEQIKYCTSEDEFAREEGHVTFMGAKIKYHPEKTYAAKELYDLEHIYLTVTAPEAVGEDRTAYFDMIGLPDTESLSELLEYNKKTYIEAK